MTQKKTQKKTAQKNKTQKMVQKKTTAKKKGVAFVGDLPWSEEDEEEEVEDEDLHTLVKNLNARVDALAGQEPVSDELGAACDGEVQAKRKAVRKQHVTSKKVLLDNMGVLLDDKTATAADMQDALQASRVHLVESFSAEVKKVREELASLPEAAGIRAVCDMYADMRDVEDGRAAEANRPNSSVVC